MPNPLIEPIDNSIFCNDPDKCIRDIEEKIKEVVKNNPLVTTQHLLSRISQKTYTVTEEIKDRFTQALCNAIDKGDIMNEGFVMKEGKYQAQYVIGEQLKFF
jgi:hypothetical protein